MKRNYFIYIFIFWYMAKIICSTTFETIGGIPVDTVSSMINYLVLVLLVIQMVFFQSYGQKEFVIIAVVSIPFLITAAVSRSFSLLSGWMFVVAAKDTSFEKIIKTVYRALLFTIFLVFVLYSGRLYDGKGRRDQAFPGFFPSEPAWCQDVPVDCLSLLSAPPQNEGGGLWHRGRGRSIRICCA